MRYLVAIGGNAITSEKKLGKVSEAIARLRKEGNSIILTHGNGPQVGELALEENKSLALLTAQTEAEIGLEIRSSLIDELGKKGLKNDVVIMITPVLVDGNDDEFREPTKPIGKFLTPREAKVMRERGFSVKKLKGGLRRVVPSPKPLDIAGLGVIKELLSRGHIVIAAGGGGVAMKRRGKREVYSDAVIDKDYVSSLLASLAGVDRMVILTNVDGAYLDFGSRSQLMINTVRAEEAERMIREGEFEEGSMLPKVRACVDFARRTGKKAAIGSISDPYAALRLKSTVVTP